jgi:hypothetical protein
MSAIFFKYNNNEDDQSEDEYTAADEVDDMDLEEQLFWWRRPQYDNGDADWVMTKEAQICNDILKKKLAAILKAMLEDDTLESIRFLFEPVEFRRNDEWDKDN